VLLFFVSTTFDARKEICKEIRWDFGVSEDEKKKSSVIN
jgi:hypothetical protein